MNRQEALSIIENVLDSLVEVGNGITDEELHKAADLLFKFRDEYFRPKDVTYIKLMDQFNEAIKELQENCKHENTEWMDYQWAPGHTMGKVKSCNRCNKIIEKSIPDLCNCKVTTNSDGLPTLNIQF